MVNEVIALDAPRIPRFRRLPKPGRAKPDEQNQKSSSRLTPT
jgi:hypothetical protein